MEIDREVAIPYTISRDVAAKMIEDDFSRGRC
jgi:hypothetical protein